MTTICIAAKVSSNSSLFNLLTRDSLRAKASVRDHFKEQASFVAVVAIRRVELLGYSLYCLKLLCYSSYIHTTSLTIALP